jgi:pyridoxine 4-dehydrogenase
LRTLAVDHLAAVNLSPMDDAEPGQRFDDQLTATIRARDKGLIDGIGLSKIPVSIWFTRWRSLTSHACRIP